jgi:hypothetical protein
MRCDKIEMETNYRSYLKKYDSRNKKEDMLCDKSFLLTLDSSLDPSARVVVHTISIATGMLATISTTVKEMASFSFSPFRSRYTNTACVCMVYDDVMLDMIVFKRNAVSRE